MGYLLRDTLVHTLLYTLSGCSDSGAANIKGIYVAELIPQSDIDLYVESHGLSEKERKVKLHRSKLRAGLPSGQFQLTQRNDMFIFGEDRSIRFISNVMDFGGKYEQDGSTLNLTIYRHNNPPGEDDISQVLKVTDDGSLVSKEEYLDWLIFKRHDLRIDYTKETLAEQIDSGAIKSTEYRQNQGEFDSFYHEILLAQEKGMVEGKAVTNAEILGAKLELEKQLTEGNK